ncbi:hypothetical protein [Actinomadura logoneensis]|uniref:hypothetical protein n=1 Tax=Actinomadura logoneensis TaxID=2293572 RepID=UPI001313E98A|nr:hypothetical protein [Actinomadura logoneensis]
MTSRCPGYRLARSSRLEGTDEGPIAEKIASCPDNETLLMWLRRAAVATSVDEVFGD